MPDVKAVTVILRNPSGNLDDHGVVTCGFYVLEGKKLIMTDSHGTPLRRNSGDMVVHELKGGEDPETFAGIHSKQFRRQIHGDSKQGCSGPLPCPRAGWL
jgi:hypothetical protein